MLDAAHFADLKSSFDRVIDTLGAQMVWTQAKPPRATKTVVAGIKIAGLQDDAIVQAYGVGARVITVKAADFATAPEKFDRFAMGSEFHIAEAVHQVHLNAQLVGYKIYVKGK